MTVRRISRVEAVEVDTLSSPEHSNYGDVVMMYKRLQEFFDIFDDCRC